MSGVSIDTGSIADGLVVTNYHVIQGASHLTARTNEGAVFQFQRVLAHPQDVALAILKFAADGAAYLKLGNQLMLSKNKGRLSSAVMKGWKRLSPRGAFPRFAQIAQ